MLQGSVPLSPPHQGKREDLTPATLTPTTPRVRDLLESDDSNAEEAVELFVYHVAKQLGALAAALQGIDALVFTAGVGEHAQYGE